jgi:hypothetical protein
MATGARLLRIGSSAAAVLLIAFGLSVLSFRLLVSPQAPALLGVAYGRHPLPHVGRPGLHRQHASAHILAGATRASVQLVALLPASSPV